MPKKLFKLIKIDLFPWDILYTVGTNEAEIEKHLREKLSYYLDDDELAAINIDKRSTIQGRCIKFKNKAILLWLRRPSQAVLAHEAFHAISFILESAGVKYSDDSDEVWAYGLQYIVKRVNDGRT